MGELTDNLRCVSASYERISLKFFEGVEGVPRTNRLYFGGNPDQYPDPGSLYPDQDLNPGIFNGSFIEIFGGVGRGIKNRLDFDGDPYHNLDLGIL